MSSSTGARSKSNANSEMTKANDTTTSPVNTTPQSNLPDTSGKNEKKKKVFIFYIIIFFPMHYIFLVFESKGMVLFSCLDEVYPSKDFWIKAKWEKLRRRTSQAKHGRRRWSYSWYSLHAFFSLFP